MRHRYFVYGWPFLLVLCLSLACFPASAQTLSEQKSVVTFILGTVHPLNPDKTRMKDQDGKDMEVEMPLGTGFFVIYPDARGGPDFIFCYLATAKHVLKDFDGTYLPKIKLRLNLKSPSDGNGFDLATEIPVADQSGNLLWLHSKNEADDLALFPLLPDQKKYDFKGIPVLMFVDDSSLKSDAVEEGDSLYFIGLMEQYYGSKKNHPVVRRGTLALMTDEQIPTPTGQQSVFIAELESWPGNSGAPVFLNLGGLRKNALFLTGSIKLMGILVGGFLNNMSAPVIGRPVTFFEGNGANTGVSFIVPAPRIKEILDAPEVQHYRDDQVQRSLKSKAQ